MVAELLLNLVLRRERSREMSHFAAVPWASQQKGCGRRRDAAAGTLQTGARQTAAICGAHDSPSLRAIHYLREPTTGASRAAES